MIPLLRARDVAAALGISRAGAYALMARVPHVRLGNRIRITAETLASVIAGATEEPKRMPELYFREAAPRRPKAGTKPRLPATAPRIKITMPRTKALLLKGGVR
jgi:hypothetical protein